MKLAVVVPGGVDRSGEVRVIPVFLTLIDWLARNHEVHVFVLHQEPEPATWMLRGATVHNIGQHRTRLRAIAAIREEHRRAPFDVVQALFSGYCSLIAVVAAKLLRRPSVVHIAGGELVALHGIGYGGRRRWRGRLREAVILRLADRVTAASLPIIASLHALGVTAQRVPLGVDLRAWPPAPPRARSGDVARLLHVASLNPVKDQTTLLRAWLPSSVPVWHSWWRSLVSTRSTAGSMHWPNSWISARRCALWASRHSANCARSCSPPICC